MIYLLMVRWPYEDDFPATTLWPDYHSMLMSLWNYAKEWWEDEWGEIPDDPEEAVEAYFKEAPEMYTYRQLELQA